MILTGYPSTQRSKPSPSSSCTLTHAAPVIVAVISRGEVQFRIAGINGELPAGYFHESGLHSREDSKTWFQSALVRVAKAAVALGEQFKDKSFFASDANGVEASKNFTKTITIMDKNATCGPLKGQLKVEVTAKGSVKGNIGFVASGKLGKGQWAPPPPAWRNAD